MDLEGGCYCGALRYKAGGKPMLKAQCHCRECQYISGGGPNLFMLMPAEEFSYTRGTPKEFTRTDIEQAVTREFCAACGTHILTRRPGLHERHSGRYLQRLIEAWEKMEKRQNEPTFEAIEWKIGGGAYVKVTLPNEAPVNVEGFATKNDALIWIRHEAQAWLHYKRNSISAI